MLTSKIQKQPTLAGWLLFFVESCWAILLNALGEAGQK